MTRTTTPELEQQLAALTDAQHAAQSEADVARQELNAARYAVERALAVAAIGGDDVDEQLLDRLAAAEEAAKLAELRAHGLAVWRYELTPDSAAILPATGDPRGVVRIRMDGSNEERTVGADEAVMFVSLGTAHVIGGRPEWWPSHLPHEGLGRASSDDTGAMLAAYEANRQAARAGR